MPSGAVTESMFGEVKVPVPIRVWTLRCLASPARPPVSRVTTPSFQPRSASRSMVGAVKVSPAWLISLVSAMTLAACSRALEGMQPTLRQTPPSGPRESTMTTLLAEVGGAERGGVAAGPGAQHQHLGVHVALLPGVGGGCAHGRRFALPGWAAPADDPYPAGAVSSSRGPAAVSTARRRRRWPRAGW